MMSRVEIGAGNKPRDGYIHMDTKKLSTTDIVGDVRTMPFEDNELEEIFGHWVLEHFYYREIPDVLNEWRRCLKPGGLLHLVTNNGTAHLSAYQEGAIDIHELNEMLFGISLKDKSKHNDIEDLHKTFWTRELVTHFFKPLFTTLDIRETWKHREEGGALKCPGIIIKAYK